MEQVNFDSYVGGYNENEVEDAKRLARELKSAINNLMNNKDFLVIYNHYTKQKVLDEAKKAVLAPEHRPEFFESILNSKAFEQYIESIQNMHIEDENEILKG